MDRHSNIHIAADKDQLGRDAAIRFIALANSNAAHGRRFSVALSGGSTPKIMYNHLLDMAPKLHDWSLVDFFWSDERNVQLNDPDSNAGMAFEQLIDHLDIDHAQTHPVPTYMDDPARIASQYEKQIRDVLGTPDGIPAFDLIFLGLGDDGHTASLFPETAALHEKKRLVAANVVDKLKTWRYTFTYPLINHANQILFLVSGSNKASIVKQIISGENRDVPAAGITPVHGSVDWLLDEEAAHQL